MKLLKLSFSLVLLICGFATVGAQTLHGLYLQEEYAPGDYPIEVVLKSNSTPVTSITIEWELNGDGVQSETINTFEQISETGATYYRFKTTDLFTVDAYQSNSLEVWLKDVNGGSDISGSTTYAFERSLKTTTRSVLLEEITATWCGYCPEGHYTKDLLKNEYPGRVLVASHHKNDGMECQASEDLINAYSAGQPRGLLNRNNFPNTAETTIVSAGVLHHHMDWDDLMRIELGKPGKVATEVSTSYNSGSRELTVDADWTFLEDMSGNYRVSCLVNQESFTSSSSAYNQSNYYGSVATSPFYGYPGSIPNYEHSDWTREILGGEWGESGVVPSAVSEGTTIDHQWTYTLPSNFDANKIYVIVVIQEYGSSTNERTVLNALDCGLNETRQQSIVDHETSTDFVFDPTILLEGAYNSNGNMSAQLGSLIPQAQPFSAGPYFYNGTEYFSSMPAKAVDWVLVEVRQGSPNLTGSKGTVTRQTKAAVITENGQLRSPDGSNGVTFKNLAKDQDYYFVIRHRNHLDVMTALPMSGAALMAVDMTTAEDDAWGNEQLIPLGDGRYGMHAGDFNQDGVIQNTDYDIWQVEPAAINVYQQADADLNGVIQNTDFDSWQNNKAKIGTVEIEY